ncbi:MBOAT family O-acyltransferase [Candidatus Njordibacter sp. Uisw_039]|uniref:MBOAT family O-acyltransferase n=1 Tax=Candidatus Njordibacter sp. Uisw_039 TaxID=3230972 RepID=UPI003D41B469
MIFSSPEFLLLLLPIYTLSCLFFARVGAFLVISSLFYIYTSAEFFLFLVAFVAFVFLLSRYLNNTALFAIVILSPLLYFKYSDWVLSQFGSLGHEALMLPLGISFYTFQLMSFFYETNKKEKFLDVLHFVTFFPQLIAGPIVRSNQFLPQKGPSKLFSRRIKFVYFGITIFAFGLAKKVLIADNIGVFLDDFDYFFLSNGGVHFFDILFAIPAILIHLYFDFSAYSDMAIGLGLMAGYRIPINFKMPMSAISITSFWQRWHISLTEFFRDYLLNSLLLHSARVKRQKLAFGISLVTYFSILGLWHGAGFNFILFGLLNGIAVLIAYSGKFSIVERWYKWVRMLGLHMLLFLIFVNFRYEVSDTKAMAGILLHEIIDIFSFQNTVITDQFAFVLLLCYLWSVFGFEGYELYRRKSRNDVPDIVVYGRRQLIALVAKTNFIWSPLVFIYALFYVGETPTFVYFQF